DQRLFSIDLRRESAYVYSSIKLRQQKRERQRMFIINKEFSYLNNKFNDHHAPLNEQQQSIESVDEQE
ncbi:unnamed protein product, partial [Rotaria sordida]